MALAVPVVVLLLTEFVLRMAGVGSQTDFFVRTEDKLNFVPNVDFGRSFGCPQLPDPFLMPATKAPGGIRIFVLGESAAAGTPDTAFGVARMLEVMLRDRYPDKRIEVFNAAMMGIDSFAVAKIARECAQHDADLLIVYAGNNDLIGAHGVATFASRLPPFLSRNVIRASLWLQSTKTGLLIAKIAGRDAASHVQDERFFLEHRIRADDPRRNTVRENFRSNIESIARIPAAGRTKVLLSTVAVNLGSSPPFGSLHRADIAQAESNRWGQAFVEAARMAESARWSDAAALFSEAISNDSTVAEAHFRLGQCLSRLRDAEGARREFQKAVDCDAIPFRTDSVMNGMIRQVARETGATFVDAEKILAERHDVPGESLFYDHVHFRFHGNHELAGALFLGVVSSLSGELGVPKEDGFPSEESVAARLAFTAWDELKLQASISRFFARPPCTLRLGNEKMVATANAEVQRLTGLFSAEAQRRAVAIYEDAMAKHPEDWRLRGNFAELLDGLNKSSAAVRYWEDIAAQFPRYGMFQMARSDSLSRSPNVTSGLDPLWSFHFQHALRLRTENPPASIDEYKRSLLYDERSAQTHNNLGGALFAAGKHDEAEIHFKRAIELMPAHAGAHLNLGLVLELKRQYADAIREFRQAVELNVQTPAAACKLAWLLSTVNDPSLRNGAEAVRVGEKVCKESGRELPAALQALAAAYAECGRFDDAVRVSEEAAQLFRNIGQTEMAKATEKFLEVFRAHKPYRISGDGM